MLLVLQNNSNNKNIGNSSNIIRMDRNNSKTMLGVKVIDLRHKCCWCCCLVQKSQMRCRMPQNVSNINKMLAVVVVVVVVFYKHWTTTSISILPTIKRYWWFYFVPSWKSPEAEHKKKTTNRRHFKRLSMRIKHERYKLLTYTLTHLWCAVVGFVVCSFLFLYGYVVWGINLWLTCPSPTERPTDQPHIIAEWMDINVAYNDYLQVTLSISMLCPSNDVRLLLLLPTK